jgi:hypothetical protein
MKELNPAASNVRKEVFEGHRDLRDLPGVYVCKGQHCFGSSLNGYGVLLAMKRRPAKKKTLQILSQETEDLVAECAPSQCSVRDRYAGHLWQIRACTDA